jgi:ATP-dependent Clp protease protease subunit
MQYVRPERIYDLRGHGGFDGRGASCSRHEGAPVRLPNSEIMMHQLMIGGGGLGGQATDVEIGAKHILKLKDRLNQILAKATGQSMEKIEKDTDRDYFMTAEEALKYGLIDGVMRKNETSGKAK